MKTKTPNINAPSVVLKAMKKSFVNVDMRLETQRPWEQVPDGYVVCDYTVPVLHEDASEVSVSFKGSKSTKALATASEVLDAAGMRVRLQPKSVRSKTKAANMTLWVSFPNEVV